MDLGEKIELIQNLPLFEGLSKDELNIIAKRLREKTIEAHTVFIEQEDKGDTAYILLEGSARVYRLTEDGEEATLAMLGQGEVVGEMSLLDDEPRSANVEALQDLRVLYLTKDDFKQILSEYPEIAIHLLKTLALRVRKTNEQIENVMFKNLHERTLKILENLATYFPNNDISFSQEELASILGATRARVTEVLNTLAKDGKIVLARHKIHVN